MNHNFYTKEKPVMGLTGTGGGLGFYDPPVGGGWEILFAAKCKDQTSGNVSGLSQNPWGAPGNSNGTFKTATASNTGASTRTLGNVGLYNAFFTKTGITQIAIASAHDGSSNIVPGSGGNFTRWVIFDLVEPITNTVYNTINTLDTYNLNNTSWHGNDSLYGSSSANNFVAGNAYSGAVSSHSNHFKCEDGNNPDRFAVWGVNRDSDNDTQVLCAYYGNLSLGKSDSWRGDNPKQSFFSYWGNDWHSNTQTQTISKTSQSSPGFNNNSTVISNIGSSTTILYMLAK